MENVTIAEAGLEVFNDVAFMFDQYRQFYDQDEDLELAKEFLGGHMAVSYTHLTLPTILPV